jgi:hypothetical protein
VLFSLATERYDVLALRPHPPGYPLFVALGKALLALADGDPNRAFVLQAALWSGVAVALLYALVRAWGSRRAALAAALLFAVAPVFAFNGTVALSYTAEAAAMLGVALAAWHCSRPPTPARLLVLGGAWALAVGIRQNLFLFLAPVVLLALWPRPAWPVDARLARELLLRAGTAASAAVALGLAWFLAMLRATPGGFGAWRHATQAQAELVVFADAVWRRGPAAFGEHVDRLAWFLHWETGLLLPLFGFVALLGVLVRRRGAAPMEPGPWRAGASVFLAAWLAPAFLFYLLVFDGWERGPLGYVLTVLPGVYVIAVLLGDHGLRRLAAAQPARLRPILGAFAVVVLLVPFPVLSADADDLVAQEVQAHDGWTAHWQRAIGSLPTNETAILTWQSWAHVQWYFPDNLAWTYFPSYRVPGEDPWALVFAMQDHRLEDRFITMYDEGPGRPDHPIPANVRTIVLFDFQLAGEGGEQRRLAPELQVEEVDLDGWRALVIHPDAEHRTVESLFSPAALGAGAHGDL